MPLPMVHLGAAQLAAADLHITDLPAYYLGSIAPDGIHMLEGWTLADKEHSHLGARDGDTAGITDFLNRLGEWENRDYALGYAVHVLTDVIWFPEINRGFRKRCEEAGISQKDRRQVYYSDTDQIDFELFRTLPGREELWRLLEQAHAPELPGVLPAEAADLWNERTRNWFYRPMAFEYPIRFITVGSVKEFLPKAAAYSVEFLKDTLNRPQN